MVFEIEWVVLSAELSTIIVDFILGLAMCKKTLKLGKAETRMYYLGAVGFFLLHGCCRTLFFLRSNVFIGLRLLFDVGTILGLASVVVLVAAIESTVFKRSKHAFTIIGVAAAGIMLVDVFTQLTYFEYRLLLWVHYITTPLLAVFIIVLYLRALIRASGEVRRNASFMLVGIVLLCVSELANSMLLNDIIPGISLLAPFLMISALLLLYYAMNNLSVWKKMASVNAVMPERINPEQPPATGTERD